MPWLTQDLETIHNSDIVIKELDGGTIGCVLAKAASKVEYSANQFVIDNIEIFNSGDLKWLAMLLGMADMSSIWCIYCLLRKQDWMEAGHALTEDQICTTIKKNLELAASAATGTDIMSVKFKPY